MKYRIHLLAQELEVLLGCEDTEAIARRLFVDGVLEGCADDFDELRDACGAALQGIGFDGSYSSNSAGKLLEALIDKLFIESE